MAKHYHITIMNANKVATRRLAMLWLAGIRALEVRRAASNVETQPAGSGYVKKP